MNWNAMSIDRWNFVLTAFVAWLSYLCILIIRRLFFHPLRNFPGPRLAAVTWLYKAYYVLIKGGEMLHNVERLHKRYGPVVRIAPDELSFNDPRAYSTIYAPGSKFTKEPSLYKMLGEDESSFGYTDPLEAKQRREILSPLFSRRAIIQLENVVQKKVDKLISQVMSYDDQSPVNMFLAFRHATVDIIASYCFAHSFDTLDDRNFHHPFITTVQATMPSFWIMKYFPILLTILQNPPEWLTLRMSPKFQSVLDLRKYFTEEVDSLLRDPTLLDHAEHETVYHHLLTPRPGKAGDYSIPSRKSLIDEAQILLQAGSDTVGQTCTMGTLHVLSNKRIKSKLMTELRAAWPDANSPFTYQSLEKLPYLTAVIKESLRLAHGVVTPLPRIISPSGTEISGRYVPPNTVVSMGCTFMHYNENVFPDPYTFSPERWIQKQHPDMENYLVPFSRGPRMCLGINLAWCELYLLFGNVFRKLDLELYETSSADFAVFKEYFAPVYQGRQLRVLVKSSPS